VTGTLVVVSFMTIAELERWAFERNWGAARLADLQRFLASFAIRPVDRALCTAWAAIMVEARRNGTPVAHADAWVAATARLEGLPLVTHNVRHYRNLSGLTIITP
jgi:tRNA(fMet)-specific endonuclease VapC